MNNKPRHCIAFPVGEYVKDELEARGWSTLDAAERLGGTAREIAINNAILDILTCEGLWFDLRLTFSRYEADLLAGLFGSEAETWLKLDAAFRKAMGGIGDDE